MKIWTNLTSLFQNQQNEKLKTKFFKCSPKIGFELKVLDHILLRNRFILGNESSQSSCLLIN